jgi:hypothetical protein
LGWWWARLSVLSNPHLGFIRLSLRPCCAGHGQPR